MFTKLAMFTFREHGINNEQAVKVFYFLTFLFGSVKYISYLCSKKNTNTMEKEYINPLGQRVVNCTVGYKVYDRIKTDKVLYRVGDTVVNNEGQERYVFKDDDAFNEDNGEVCFISEASLIAYEKALKIITSDEQKTDEQKWNDIFKVTAHSGLTRQDIEDIYGKRAKKIFKEIEKLF